MNKLYKVTKVNCDTGASTTIVYDDSVTAGAGTAMYLSLIMMQNVLQTVVSASELSLKVSFGQCCECYKVEIAETAVTPVACVNPACIVPYTQA